jgi:hypothetical protein
MRPRIAVLLMMMSVAAAAQRTNGYVFFAPGGATCCGHTSMSLHFGAGVEARIWKGLGANAEIGALGPKEHFDDGVFGVFSPGATYHFRRGTEQRLEPFLAGGYSLIFRSGRDNLGYVGGGVNYWLSNTRGLRIEFRDHIHGGYSAVHLWGFRFGLVFR